ncbi:hypothetical protein SASPL_135941 [Salvia splendens]|uniref:Disease resistance protein winged helix domain-containing protein n=1 Tax=Salvia splendens TaxID=180675 RepID=A0A8X8X134_SALSN|nr:probable disease resistance protein At1g59620 [Salvia splendens]KAG6403713.1 hypothetical protein SASPL_135941 [Salvia splendens]
MRIRDTANIGFAIKAGLLTELLKIKGKPCIPSNVPAEEINMFEKIRKEMVRKCGNLPLAISLLGGILSNKESSEKWKLVNKNISARTGVENLNDEIQQVLHLSYLDLPCYLKTCFLYTGMYKKDEVIPAIDPCVKWIAQGMISHHNHPNEVKLMEIAQGYLTELASRLIVEIARDDPTRRQTTRTCKLHDAVREMCLSLARDEDFGLQNAPFDYLFEK